jgi:elongation factor Ts
MEEIKKLREITGAGMVDCKKALDEAGGDIEKAVELLRKKGIAKAAKRGDRETTEGVIKLSVNNEGTEGYILQLSAETDFVSRNEQFQKMAENILEVIKKNKPSSLEELNSLPIEDGLTVEEALGTLSGTIGEKMDIKRFDILSVPAGTVASYSHMEGRIGALAGLDKPNSAELAYDIAMQAAASDPKYIRPEEVEAVEMEKEKEIYREQLIKEGKPEEMIEKILTGKMAKYYEEVCLLKQEFIKDDKKKVEQILGDAKVVKFVRYSL